MSRMKCFISAFLGFLIFPVIGMAAPVHYTAIGSVMDVQDRLLQIVGNVVIDDQLKDWQTNQPASLQQGSGTYKYGIESFSLKVGDYPQYSFSGNGGSLYMSFLGNPGNMDFGDFMWFLSEGDNTSQWNYWWGEVFTFYNADWTRQQLPAQYGSLSPIIRLEGLSYLPPPHPDPILGQAGGIFNVWLVENNTAPVPEPSTIALLGAGLMGIALRKKTRQRREK